MYWYFCISFLVIYLNVQCYGIIYELNTNNFVLNLTWLESQNYTYFKYTLMEEQFLNIDMSERLKIETNRHLGYKLVLVKPSNLIKIRDNFIIYSNEIMDREQLCNFSSTICQIEIEVGLQKDSTLKTVFNLRIVIQDINDNNPRFENHRKVINLSENLDVGSSILLPSAVDLDGIAYNIDRYEIRENSDEKYFMLIYKNSYKEDIYLPQQYPQMLLMRPLDRETKDMHRISLIAFDKGMPPRSAQIIIEIQVDDVNDNQPQFLNSHYFITFVENSTTVPNFLQVQATDSDLGKNGEIWYSFSPGTINLYGDWFTIDSKTGMLSNTQSLDYESFGAEITLEVLARDRSDNLTSMPAYIHITLRDVNDNKPLIVIEGLKLLRTFNNCNYPNLNSQTYQVELDEMNMNNIIESKNYSTNYIITINDLDSEDNGNVVCEIDTASHLSLFKLYEISDKKYHICFSCDEKFNFNGNFEIFDREQQSCFYATIKCSDNGQVSLFSLVTLIVTIRDINDNNPMFVHSPYYFTVRKDKYCSGNDVLGFISATDEDTGANAIIHYHVKNCTETSYSENSAKEVCSLNDMSNSNAFLLLQNGYIYSNYEHSNICQMNSSVLYECAIKVSDSGTPILASTTLLYLLIYDDETENGKMFFNSEKNIFVYENIPTFQIFANLNVFLTVNCSYSFQMFNDNEIFLLDKNSGDLSVQRILDRETNSLHFLTFTAIPDRYKANKHCSVEKIEVGIYVLDVNDNNPEILSPKQNDVITKISNHTDHLIVSTIIASDKDLCKNGELQFELISDGDENLFQINDLNIILQSGFQYNKIYNLLLIAKDQGNNQKIQRRNFSVRVLQGSSTDGVPSKFPTLTYSISSSSVILGAFLCGIIFMIGTLLCWYLTIHIKKIRVERKNKEDIKRRENITNLESSSILQSRPDKNIAQNSSVLLDASISGESFQVQNNFSKLLFMESWPSMTDQLTPVSPPIIYPLSCQNSVRYSPYIGNVHEMPCYQCSPSYRRSYNNQGGCSE